MDLASSMVAKTTPNKALKFALATWGKPSRKPKHMPQLTKPEVGKLT
jgi:hypothetical protein